MTELERARAHLRGCQIDLVWARGWRSNTIPKYETAVLAALSWVWEEQENERMDVAVAFITDELFA